MADETRRSARATKGQHTKNSEEADTPISKPLKKRGSKQKAAEPTPPSDDEGPAKIRCICGYVVEDEDDERVMVICDSCLVWQHNECMEISENPDELPDQYFCEICRPQDHKELLAKVARGKKPWEERALQREREEEERKAKRRKGGKKGKKGRASEVKVEESKEIQNNGTLARAPPVDVAQANNLPDNSQKRKLAHEVTYGSPKPDIEEPLAKMRKTSSAANFKPPLPVPVYMPTMMPAPVAAPVTAPVAAPVVAPVPPDRRKSSASATPARRDSGKFVLQAELVENIGDLHSDARRKIADALVSMFVDHTRLAQKKGKFHMPLGQTVESFGLKLGLAVEFAMYLNFWGQSAEPSIQYRDKYSTIRFNVKKNPALGDRLLTGELSPNDLSKMSSDDMASKELQEKTAEMKKDAEKQHMLVHEEGPRIRRTHKGEEFVEDDSQHIAALDSVFSSMPARRRGSDIDMGVPKQASPVAAEGPQSPTAMEGTEHAPSVGGSGVAGSPLAVQTTIPPRPLPAPIRKSSTNFNIQDVWSSVDAPDLDKRVRTSQGHEVMGSQSNQMQDQVASGDADIDRLLKDEEPEEEAPYSPVDYAAQPTEPGSIVWRGKMSMATVTEFDGSATYVAGGNISTLFPWSQLMPSTLSIGGRIDIERASEYLCGLRFSHTTDVTVAAVTPNQDPDSVTQFTKLFQYFTDRNRYGVVAKGPIPNVRDIYVVPIEAGMNTKPPFIEILEHCTIENPVPERMLLVTYVVKNNNSPSDAQGTPHNFENTAIASPLAAGPPQPHSTFQAPQKMPNMPQPTSHMSPLQGYPPPQQSMQIPLPYNNTALQLQQSQHQQPIPHHQSPYPLPHPIGMDAAIQALGTDLANSPAIAELLNEAPYTGVPEFQLMKETLESVPASRNDFNMLKGLLTLRSQQGGGGQ